MARNDIVEPIRFGPGRSYLRPGLVRRYPAQLRDEYTTSLRAWFVPPYQPHSM
jgi:hypothetical protein